MFKYVGNSITKSNIQSVFHNLLVNNTKENTWFFQNFKQKICKNKNKNLILFTQDESILTTELLKQNFNDYSIIEYNLKNSIDEVKRKTNAVIIFNSRGIVIVKDNFQINNVYYNSSLTLTSIKQLIQFSIDPEEFINKFNDHYELVSTIPFSHQFYKIIFNINNTICGRIYITPETQKRLLSISNLIDKDYILTKEEFKIIKNLQTFKKRNFSVNGVFTLDDIDISSRDPVINIDNTFSCYSRKFCSKITGINSNIYISMEPKDLFRSNYVILNCIKHLDKLTELISKLEYQKLKQL